MKGVIFFSTSSCEMATHEAAEERIANLRLSLAQPSPQPASSIMKKQDSGRKISIVEFMRLGFWKGMLIKDYRFTKPFCPRVMISKSTYRFTKPFCPVHFQSSRPLWICRSWWTPSTWKSFCGAWWCKIEPLFYAEKRFPNCTSGFHAWPELPRRVSQGTRSGTSQCSLSERDSRNTTKVENKKPH